MTDTGSQPADVRLAEFMRLRPRLFGIAYRMLGTATDADDVVQEAWIRWQRTDLEEVRNAGAFLSTVTTRLAVNALTSARAQRETYIGPWLPEPLLTSEDDPTLGAERAEALDLAVLFLLERLTPLERAVYVLREAFEYPFAQIAEMVEITEPYARQLARRARGHIANERGHTASPHERRRFFDAFTAAARTGDLNRLEKLLTEDAVSYADGGGNVTAARHPVLGAARIARYVVGAVAKWGRDVSYDLTQINGEHVLLMSQHGTPIAVASANVSATGIRQLFVQVNPDKLHNLRVAA